MPQDGFLGLLDMLDGGGAGRAGPTFEGGPLSEFLNKLGIKPAGYRDRLAEARPMARPAGPGAAPPSAPPRPAPPPNPYAPGAITQTTLPPPGQMPNDQLIRMILEALQAGPSAIGYGRR